MSTTSLGRALGVALVGVLVGCGSVSGNPGADDDGGDGGGNTNGDNGTGGDGLPVGDDGNPLPQGLVRFTNTTCSLSGSAATTVFEGIANSSLTGLLPVPGAPGKLLLVRQSGLMVVFDRDTYTDNSETTALDLVDRVYDNGGGEKGLYSAAFAPDFGPSGGYLYVSYAIEDFNDGNSAVTGNERDTRVERYTCTRTNTLTCDKGSARTVIEIERPNNFQNHNGGQIFFGGDGYLYITAGDSADGGDPQNWAQNLQQLQGKILRIDPSQDAGGKNYAIPPGNMGAAEGALPEIYAYGFRNPWRASYDAVSGRIFVGDVGQGQWEEVDILEAKRNYGWRMREGAHQYGGTGGAACPTCVDPVFEYSHDDGGIAITGGFVYRGSDIPTLVGAYIFADYLTAEVWRLDEVGGDWVATKIMTANGAVTSFGLDDEGEIYILHFNGDIERLTLENGADNPPPTLTATGCYANVANRQLVAAAVPYDVRVPLWSDDATKRRYFVLPGTATISASISDAWVFPVGTILIKEFELQTTNDPASVYPVETRFLVQVEEDVWRGYDYIWNDAHTEATLRDNVQEIGDYTHKGAAHQHVFPSRGQCNTCHTPNGGFVLGLRTENVNRDHDYGRGSENQVAAFGAAGFLDAPLAQPATWPALTFLEDSTASTGSRARSYLASNCEQCHSGTANGGREPDLRYATSLADSKLCEVINHASPPIIPGSPGSSPLITERDGIRGSGQMPPLATLVVHRAAVDVLEAWIDAMDDVPATLAPEYICPP